MKDSTIEIILLMFALIFTGFYLSFHSFAPQQSDEVEYLRNAYLLAHGNSPITTPEHAYNYVTDGSKYFSRYPMFASALLIPFLQAPYWFGLIFFLLGLWVFYLLLKENEVNPLWTLLWFAYYPFVYASTTLMMDLPSTVLIMFGFLFYLKGKHRDWHVELSFISGIFFGLALWLKPANAIALIAVGLFLLKSPKRLYATALGVLPFFAPLLAYNHWAYGSYFATGYSFLQGNQQFIFGLPNAANIFFGNLGNYVVFLTLFFPLLWIAVFKDYKLRWETLTLLFLSLMFFSLANVSPGLNLNDFLIQYRYLYPVVALLLIGYAKILGWLIKDRAAIIIPLAIIALLLCTPLLVLKQNASYRTMEITKDIYSHTPNGSLIVGVQEGQYFTEVYGNRAYLGYLRQTYTNDSNALISEKLREYNDSYVIYQYTPYFDYKSGINESRAKLDALKGELVYSKTYEIPGLNTIKMEVYHARKT